MKKQIIGLASLMAVAASAVVPMTAQAEILGNKNLSANIAMTTAYYFRGFDQNDDGVAIQAGLDYAHDSGLYVGTWASMVDEATYAGSNMELDIYAGWAGDLGPVGIDVGVLRYMYPNDSTPNKNDTTEWHLGLSHDFGAFALGATAHHSSDFYGLKGANYYELNLDVPINEDWSAHAHAGSTKYDKKPTNGGGDDYNDYGVGVSTVLGPFGVDLTAVKASGVSGGCGAGTACGSELILSLSLDL